MGRVSGNSPLFRYVVEKMCVSVLVLILILSSTQVIARTAVDLSSETIRCLMLKEHQHPCTVLGGHPIPKHLIQAFDNLPQNVQTELQANDVTWNLTSADFAKIQPAMWLLMPVNRLAKLSGMNLSTVLMSWPQEPSIAAHIMNALQTSNQRKTFIDTLSPDDDKLSERVQSIIATSISRWERKDWDLPIIVHAGNSLLAHFPPECLLPGVSRFTDHLIFFFQSWEGFDKSEKWMQKPRTVQRIWAQVLYTQYYLKMEAWSDIHLRRFLYLLPGMTSDELNRLQDMNKVNVSSKDRQMVLELSNFDMQQTRTLFDIFYSQRTLSNTDFMECVNIVSKLSPLQLQKFNIYRLNIEKAQVLTNINNYPAVKQLSQMYIARKALQEGQRNVSSLDLGADIKLMGPMIVGLTLDALEQFSSKHLEIIHLTNIDTPQLSFIQAYYLTGNGTVFDLRRPHLFTSLHYLLKSLPAATIRRFGVGEISSTSWMTLVTSLPSDNLPRSIGLFNKIDEMLGDAGKLETLLENRDNNVALSHLPSNFLKNVAKRFNENLRSLARSYEKAIRHLPSNLLSLILNENRNGRWTWNDFVNGSRPLHLFLNGLTCLDVQQAETADFVLIISEYNKVRESMNSVFPKNLQYCCQQKLIEYLEMKSRIMQDNLDEGLMSLLEPGEIEAVGGYILASLPTSVIASSKYRSQILSLISQLSVPELMLAVSDTKMSKLIDLFLDEYGLSEDADELINATQLFQMGNLMLFLPPSVVARIQPSAFQLVLQLNYTDKRLCADTATRSAWATLITNAFKEPSSWTGGVLTTIGDFLLVMSESDLRQISKSSCRDVGVTFPSHYGDTIEWWSEDTAYYKACISTMNEVGGANYLNDVKKLVRWQLKVVQWELDTVKSASDLLNELYMPAQSANMKVHVFNTAYNNFSRIAEKLGIESKKEDIKHRDNVKKNEQLIDASARGNKSQHLEFTPDLNLTADDKEESENSEGSENLSTTVSFFPSTEESIHDTPEPLHTSMALTGPKDSKGVTSSFLFDFFFKNDRTEQKDKIDQTTETKSKINLTSIESTTDLNHIENATVNIISSVEPTENTTSSTNIPILTPEMKYNETEEVEIITELTVEVKETDIHRESKDYIPSEVVHETVDGKKYDITTMVNNFQPVPTTMMPMNSEVNTENMSSTKSDDVNKTDLRLVTTVSTVPDLFELESGNETVESIAIEDDFKEPNKDDLFAVENSSEQVNNSSETDFVNHDRLMEENIINMITKRKRRSVIANELMSNYAIQEIEEPVHDVELNGVHSKDSTLKNAMEKREARETVQPKISCDALKIVGEISHLAFNETDLDVLSNNEIKNCLDAFRVLDFPSSLKKKIWKRLEKKHIHLYGTLIQAAEIEELNMNFSLDEPWILEILSYMSASMPESQVIAYVLEKVFEDNAHDNIGPDGLVSLSNLICQMNEEDRQAILSERKDLQTHLATAVLGKIRSDCASSCLSDLATFASYKHNFGNVKNWDSYDLASLGVIPAGLKTEEWEDLLSNDKTVLSGLQPEAAKCLTKEKLEIIPPESLSLIQTKTLRIIYKEKFSLLTEKQKFALSPLLLYNVTDSKRLLPEKRHRSSPVPGSHSHVTRPSILNFSLILLAYYSFCNII